MNEKIFVSGVKSGLGKYLYEKLDGFGLTRDTSEKELELVKKRGKLDVIIHCAFNSKRGITSENLYDYISDNVFLTKKLVSLPHKKFIFISSIEVYPKNNILHKEDEIIDVDKISNLYGLTKLISEAIIKKHCNNYLILRATALLGGYSRKNSLLRILQDKECVLTLAPESSFNYVLHSDVLEFIKYALEKDIIGIYNLAASKNIQLKEVAEIYNKEVKFGSYYYKTGDIDNSKISSIFPIFKKTSEDNIKRFIEEENI
ncbi:MAG: hypothetical protein DRN24_03795 [Thermoplasmata archaeon]|nr:MAG: hypothetical protein DRN24_03795 [Thermoplasmata archaeon]